MRLLIVLTVAIGSMVTHGCQSNEGTTLEVDSAAFESDADAGVTSVEEVDDGPSVSCCTDTVCGPGSVCVGDRCHPALVAGACYDDSDCQAEQGCEGATVCACSDASCVPATGQCRYPEGCCNAAQDCGGGQQCVQGLCIDAPDEVGTCWTDLNCKVGEVCEGAQPCPCGREDCVASAGQCSLPGVCCLTDDECGSDGRCIGNACYPEPSAPRCFSNDDCAGLTECAGPYVCPCGDSSCLVATSTGVCTGQDVCCKTASDCGPTEVCVDGMGCAPAPAGGGCYIDDHCGLGAVCENAQLCGCGDLCPTGESLPGTCRTLTIPCADESDCGVGLRCVVPDRLYCPGQAEPALGVCVADISDGCWSSSDCGYNQHCQSEYVCTNEGGCDQPNVAGVCETFNKLDHCCNSHLDCGEGFECRNSNTTLTCPPGPTSTCVAKPTNGETCWNYLDCLEGQVCNEVRICACGAPCFKSKPGWCGSPVGLPCKSDVDCGSGYDCAKDPDCKLNPCFNTTDCPIAGKCKQKQLGACWGHEECAQDEYCKGLTLCPNDEDCQDPDTPGICTLLEPEGACCDGYTACQPGLRCISAAFKTGCALDVSAVCVQRPEQLATNTCFVDEDCGPARTCVGAELCACGLAGCDIPPTVGQCELIQP